MKGRKPWNYGHTADSDPRVKQNTEKTAQKLREMHAEGRLTPWIKGKTKETEPILQRTAVILSQKTKEQYARTGKMQWLLDRPGLNRTGRKNSDYQKQKAREAILHSLFSGKIVLKKSKLEQQVKTMLEQLNIVIQEVMVDGIGIPDFFLPKYNMMLFVDGEYYHSLENVSIRDKRQTEQLEEMGFVVLRLEEQKIKSFNNNQAKLKQILDETKAR